MEIVPLIFEKALGYFVTALCGGMVAAIIHLWRKVGEIKKKEQEKERTIEAQNEAMRDALRAMLRDRIFQACRYHIGRGFITPGDLEVLDAMNESYHKLNGNGVAARAIHQVHQLQLRIEEIH